MILYIFLCVRRCPVWVLKTKAGLAHCLICNYLAFHAFRPGSQCGSVSPSLSGPNPSQPHPGPLSFPFPGLDIHTECEPMFLFLQHISCMGVSPGPCMCRRLMCLVRSPTSSLQCFPFCQLINWTYLLTVSSKHWASPVPITGSPVWVMIAQQKTNTSFLQQSTHWLTIPLKWLPRMENFSKNKILYFRVHLIHIFEIMTT